MIAERLVRDGVFHNEIIETSVRSILAGVRYLCLSLAVVTNNWNHANVALFGECLELFRFGNVNQNEYIVTFNSHEQNGGVR